MPKLYPIVDVDACSRVGIPPRTLALWWAALGVRRLQVRAKSAPSGQYLTLLSAVVEAVGDDVEVFANDRADLAELAGCAGVHVGQGDMPLAVVKATFPQLRVGISTHDLGQLQQALLAVPDYVAFGPVFATGSKQNPEPCVGIDGLRRAHALARAARVPLVAIGGLGADNLDQVRAHCEHVATISALTAGQLEAVTARYRALQAALGEAGSAALTDLNQPSLDGK